MKHFLLCVFSLLLGMSSFCQDDVAPYLKYQTLPSVKLLLTDSSGWELKAKLDKKKPLLLIIFSPECDHCKHETEDMVKNMDKFKKIQVVMATPLSLSKMNAFIKEYKLSQFANITVGRDYAYILPTYYGIRNLPFHAFYTKNKKLITAFEGNMTTEKILSTFGKK